MRKSNKDKLPNFFIVGAMRSGTTSLYYYLKQHPKIYMCPIKETNYFAKDIDPRQFTRKNKRESLKVNIGDYIRENMPKTIHSAYVRDWRQYKSLFKNVNKEKATGECSPSYLFSDVSAKNIKKIIPNAKIIIVLRNPLQRAYSHYKLEKQREFTNLTFLEAVKEDRDKKVKGWGINQLYVELGLYYKQVKRYLSQFGKNQIKIFLYEELIENPNKLLKEIFKFLGVNKNVYVNTSNRHNASKIKEQEISEEAKNYLKNFFDRDINRLSTLIKKDLSSWITDN